jgi:hypothetical protein
VLLDTKSNVVNWSLLVDGTSLYYAQRRVNDKKMNYAALARILSDTVNSVKAPSPAYYYTTHVKTNDAQMHFIKNLRTNMRWDAQLDNEYNASIPNQKFTRYSNIIRFDAMISFRICEHMYERPNAHLVIVSDAWPLAGPVQECLKTGTRVTLAFFGTCLDDRWRAITDEYSTTRLKFLNLDHLSDKLFSTGSELAPVY